MIVKLTYYQLFPLRRPRPLSLTNQRSGRGATLSLQTWTITDVTEGTRGMTKQACTQTLMLEARWSNRPIRFQRDLHSVDINGKVCIQDIWTRLSVLKVDLFCMLLRRVALVRSLLLFVRRCLHLHFLIFYFLAELRFLRPTQNIMDAKGLQS